MDSHASKCSLCTGAPNELQSKLKLSGTDFNYLAQTEDLQKADKADGLYVSPTSKDATHSHSELARSLVAQEIHKDSHPNRCLAAAIVYDSFRHSTEVRESMSSIGFDQAEVRQRHRTRAPPNSEVNVTHQRCS